MRKMLQIVAFAAAAALAGCGGGGSSTADGVQPPPVPERTPTFLFSSGDLLAVEGQQVLRRSIVAGGLDLVVRQDLRSGVLQSLGAFGAYGGNAWQLADGRAYAAMDADDCRAQGCVYVWDAQATTSRNLSEANPFYAGLTPGLADFDEAPLARGPFVMWTAWQQVGGYMLHDVSTGSYGQIPVPPQASYVGNWGYDMGLAGGTPQVVFWGQTGGSGSTATLDIFHWDAASGTTTRLTDAAAQEIAPQTDGVRVAWQHWPVGSGMEGAFTLMEQSLSGSPASTVSVEATRFLLRDGVLAWTEQGSSGETLRVSTGSGASTVSPGSAKLLANAQGHVVYLGDGDSGYGLYEWDAAPGRSTFITAEAPSFTVAFVASDAVIFQIRDAVYRFPF